MIDVLATTTYTDGFITSSVPIFGFDYQNNQINTSNIYTESFGEVQGISADIRNGADAQTRVITPFLDRNFYDIIFRFNNQEQRITSSINESESNVSVILSVANGSRIRTE